MNNITSEAKTLSILIPVYNEVCVGIVSRLSVICQSYNNLLFEIIVGDDASTDINCIAKNRGINDIDNCSYVERSENKGSGAMRNYLASISRYDWMLFLDCDMDILDDKFISRYLDCQDMVAVVNGGISIGRGAPSERYNLKRMYEHAEEKNHNCESRTKNKYACFRSTNYMIHRDIAKKFPFDERYRRYEDVLLGKRLKEGGIPIVHINNPMVMNDFECNADYIRKIERSMDVLYEFRDELTGFSPMLKYVDLLNKSRMIYIVSLWHKCFGALERHILSSTTRPTLLIFNLYRLGYFTSLFHKKNNR